MENSWTEGSDDSWMTASAAGAAETNLAKIYNIHRQASWSDLTQEEETPFFMSHDITQRKHNRAASTFGKYHLSLVWIHHGYFHTDSPGDNLQVSHSDLVRRLIDGLKKKKKANGQTVRNIRPDVLSASNKYNHVVAHCSQRHLQTEPV